MMADVAGVRAAEDAREKAFVLLGNLEADGANAVPEKAIDDLAEVCQLIDEKNVDLGALIFETVLLVLDMAEEDLRAVPEPDLALDDLGEPGIHPISQESPKTRGALHVVFHEVVADAPEQIDLQPRNLDAPNDGRVPDTARLPAAGSAAK